MLNICTTYKALRGLDGVKINRSLLHHALKNTENIDTGTDARHRYTHNAVLHTDMINNIHTLQAYTQT